MVSVCRGGLLPCTILWCGNTVLTVKGKTPTQTLICYTLDAWPPWKATSISCTVTLTWAMKALETVWGGKGLWKGDSFFSVPVTQTFQEWPKPGKYRSPCQSTVSYSIQPTYVDLISSWSRPKLRCSESGRHSSKVAIAQGKHSAPKWHGRCSTAMGKNTSLGQLFDLILIV